MTTARTTLLEEALEAWTDAREGVIAELENLPPEEWERRPAAETRSVAELAAHILEVAEMMVGELTAETAEFAEVPFEQLLERHAGELRRERDRERLLRALRERLEEGIGRFRDAGEIRMLGSIRRFDGETGTRLAWLHHGIAQEEYHRGQIALHARLAGRVPALTKRIRGEET